MQNFISAFMASYSAPVTLVVPVVSVATFILERIVKKKGKSKKILYAIRALLIILIATLVASAFLTAYEITHVSVPNVVGLTYDNAKQTLVLAGLNCEGDLSPETVVMDQSKPAGASVKVGATITLFPYNKDVEYIALSNLEFVDSSFGESPAFEMYEISKDNLGNTYQGGCGGRSSFEENWQKYDISQYKEVKGRVILNYESRADNPDENYIKIYGDDDLVWTSPSIKSGTEPVDFELGIGEFDTMTISIQGTQSIRLVDCYLYEEIGGERQSSVQLPDVNNRDVVSLYEMDYWNASNPFQYYEDVRDNIGNTYTHGLGGGSYWGESWQEYHIKQQYKKLQGRIVLNYDHRAETNDSTYVKIYGDDILLYTSPLISAGQEPVDFSIDVDVINNLRISIQGTEMVRLVDCSLYVDGDANPLSTMQSSQSDLEKDKVPLHSLDYWQASMDGAFRVYGVAKDNLGNPYGDAIGGTGWNQDNWQEYYIQGQYKSIDGTIILDYDARATTDDESYVKIYTDETLVYTSPLISAGQEPTPFHIDLTGVEKLRISIHGNSMILLVDTMLEKA